jgi:tripartite ATP-independent transporter DctP family solute receptor
MKISPRTTKSVLAALALITLSTVGLSGCSSTVHNTSAASGSQKKVVLKLADTLPVNDVENQSLQKLADEVRKKTNGSVDIQIYPNGQLGGEVDAMQSLANGTVQIALAGSTGSEALDAFYTPYAFKSQSELESVISGNKLSKFFTDFRQTHKAALLGWLTRSPFQTTSNTPIRTPADLKGLKIRVAQQAGPIAVYKGLGANVTSLAFTEVFGALQSGAITAQDNPADLIQSSKLNEVQKYLEITNQVYAPFWVWINDDTLKSLSSKQRTAIQQSMADVHKSNAIAVEAASKKAIADLKEAGMEVIYPDNAAFRTAAFSSSVKPYLEEVWGAKTFAELHLGK